MVKIKDGISVTLGGTFRGSSDYLLLADGTTKKVSDFVKTSTLSNYVTLNTEQTITASKTFSDIVIPQGKFIFGKVEDLGSILYFDGTRTVVGSAGASTSKATHIRSKTGHATVGNASGSEIYTVLDSGNSSVSGRTININGDTTTWTNDGGDADKLDGYQLSAIPYAVNVGSSLGTSEETGKSNDLKRTMFWRDNNRSRIGVTIMHSTSSSWALELCQGYGDTRLYVRSKNNGTWTDTKSLAYLDEIPGNDKVLQSLTTTGNYKPIVLGYDSNSTAGTGLADTLTNLVFTSNNLYALPSTGTICAKKFKTIDSSSSYVILGDGTTKLQTSSSTASTIVARDSASDINCRLVRCSYGNQTTISGAIAYRISTSDNYIRFCSDKAAIRTFLDVPANSKLGEYLPLSGGSLNAGGVLTVATNSTDTTYGGGIQIREYRYKKNEVNQAYTYAPGICFHWAGIIAKKLAMFSDGTLNWGDSLVAVVDETYKTNINVSSGIPWDSGYYIKFCKLSKHIVLVHGKVKLNGSCSNPYPPSNIGYDLVASISMNMVRYFKTSSNSEVKITINYNITWEITNSSQVSEHWFDFVYFC